MKQKDIKSIHSKSKAELLKDLKDKQKQLLKFRLDNKVKRDKNSRKSRILKKDIAIISTFIRELEIKEQIKT